MICILSSKGPSNAPVLGIAACLPGGDLGGERGLIRETPIQALAIENADFDLGHVEPTGMLRRVVEFDAVQQCLCFLDAQHLLKALTKVGVEIIHDQVDPLGGGINLFEQMLDESDKVGLGTMVGDPDGAAPALGFYGHEQVAAR